VSRGYSPASLRITVRIRAETSGPGSGRLIGAELFEDGVAEGLLPGPTEESVGLNVILVCPLFADMVEMDSEFGGVERVAFAEVFAGRDDLVPGFELGHVVVALEADLFDSPSGRPQHGAVKAVRQIEPCLAHRVKGRPNGYDATLFLGPESPRPQPHGVRSKIQRRSSPQSPPLFLVRSYPFGTRGRLLRDASLGPAPRPYRLQATSSRIFLNRP
jgi:hypothetical protein